MVLVGCGGAAGALARWAIASAVDVSADGFPWPTLAVNLLGCLAIGIAARRLAPATDVWFAAVTGALGGFTTYSAFAEEVRVLLADDRATTALVYVGATVAGGLLAVELGRAAAR